MCEKVPFNNTETPYLICHHSTGVAETKSMGFESMGSESTWTVLSVCTSVSLQVVES